MENVFLRRDTPTRALLRGDEDGGVGGDLHHAVLLAPHAREPLERIFRRRLPRRRRRGSSLRGAVDLTSAERRDAHARRIVRAARRDLDAGTRNRCRRCAPPQQRVLLRPHLLRNISTAAHQKLENERNVPEEPERRLAVDQPALLAGEVAQRERRALAPPRALRKPPVDAQLVDEPRVARAEDHRARVVEEDVVIADKCAERIKVVQHAAARGGELRGAERHVR